MPWPMPAQDPEDIFLRNMIIIALTVAVIGLLTVGTVVTIMVSTNFNILNWME